MQSTNCRTFLVLVTRNWHKLLWFHISNKFRPHVNGALSVRRASSTTDRVSCIIANWKTRTHKKKTPLIRRRSDWSDIPTAGLNGAQTATALGSDVAPSSLEISSRTLYFIRWRNGRCPIGLEFHTWSISYPTKLEVKNIVHQRRNRLPWSRE